MRRCTWLAIAAAIGCTPAWSEPIAPGIEPGAINVCVDLPANQLPAAYDAVKLWDDALHNWKRVRFVEAPDGPHCDIAVFVDWTGEGQREETAAWVNGTGGREVHMIRGRYEFDVTGFLLHELGHALGAQHLAGTLMNPAITPHTPRCPDGPTVAQVAAWNRIEIEILSWCAP